MNQGKRNIRLMGSLVLLLVMITALVVFSGYDSESIDKNVFKVDELELVDRIELRHENVSIELKLDAARWKVNGKLADRNMIDVLFATLQQAIPKRPVSFTQRDSLSQLMDKKGIAVKLFVGDAPVQQFITLGNKQKTQAYFKSPREATPYIMAIPGYRVYVSGVFELPESGWLDKHVFNFNWRNFQDLSVEFPNQKNENFEVRFGDGFFTIPSLPLVDTTKLNDLLDGISLLMVNRYVESGTGPYDSLLKTTPYMVITVHDVAKNAYTFETFKALPGKSEVIGRIGGSQLALFDSRQMQPVIRPKSFFEKK